MNLAGAMFDELSQKDWVERLAEVEVSKKQGKSRMTRLEIDVQRYDEDNLQIQSNGSVTVEEEAGRDAKIAHAALQLLEDSLKQS